LGVSQWRLVATRVSGYPRTIAVALTHSDAVTHAVALDVYDGAAGTRLDVSQWRLAATGLSRYPRGATVAGTGTDANTHPVAGGVHDGTTRT
jgi:hypothetical protein